MLARVFPYISLTPPLIIYVYSVSSADVIDFSKMIIALLGVMSFITYLLIISR